MSRAVALVVGNFEGCSVTVQTFRDVLSLQPFCPFRLVMSSGQSFEVRHPEMAWLTRHTIMVALDATDPASALDHRILSLLHVTAIEPLLVPV